MARSNSFSLREEAPVQYGRKQETEVKADERERERGPLLVGGELLKARDARAAILLNHKERITLVCADRNLDEARRDSAVTE